MAAKKRATEKRAATKAEPAQGAVEVTNHSTVALTICGVTIPKGESALVKKFDPEAKIHASWLRLQMISTKPR